jgi:hypothetical protein
MQRAFVIAMRADCARREKTVLKGTFLLFLLEISLSFNWNIVVGIFYCFNNGNKVLTIGKKLLTLSRVP